jgi:hypothetical protein
MQLQKENVKKILNKLCECFMKNELYYVSNNALEKLSSISFVYEEASNIIQLITKHSVDQEKLIGDLVGALVNIYSDIGELTQIVKHENFDNYTKDTIYKLIYELRKETWNIFKYYLKIKAKS